jgi:GT2 family glycosyltransferase
VEFTLSELSHLNKEIVDFFSKEDISALVVSFGKKKHLKDSLDHLLTQKINLDLEVGVWNVLGDKSIKEVMDSQFPEVKYFSSQVDDRSPNALLQIAENLKGDYILLLSEDILLLPDTAESLYKALKKVPRSDFLSPRIIVKKHSYGVWLGKRNPIVKMLSGRFGNILWRFRKTRAEWIYSECMLFRKEAVYMLRLNSRPLNKRNVFLWEKTKSGKEFLYEPDLFVYKKK